MPCPQVSLLKRHKFRAVFTGATSPVGMPIPPAHGGVFGIGDAFEWTGLKGIVLTSRFGFEWHNC